MRLRGGYFSFSTRFSLFARISYLFFELMSRGKGVHFFTKETSVPFCWPKKEPKRHQGASFDEHLACAGAHRRCPLDPRLRRTPSWKMGTCVRRLRTQDLASFLPRGHRPLQGRNLKVSALYAHHLVWQSCGSRAIDDDRTKQVGAHQAVYDREQKLANFDGNRPQWAEWRGVHGQNLGRRKRVRGQRDPLP